MACRASLAPTAKGNNNEQDPLVEMLERCFNIRATRQELDAPASGLIISILHEALVPFGLNQEALTVPRFLLPSEATHIESSVPLSHYVKVMQDFFCRLGIPDIGLQDLANPKPKRTRKLLKILVNSWLRMTAIYSKYKEKEKKQLEAKKILHETKAASSARTAEVNRLAGLLGAIAGEAEKLDKEQSACEKALAASCEKKAAIVSDYQQLKTTHYASTEVIQRTELEIWELKESVEEKRAGVCRDPAARKKKIAADTETLTSLESAVVDFQRKLSVIEEKVKLVPQIRDALQKILTTADECEAKFDEIMELRESKEVEAKKRIKVEHAKHMLKKKLELMGEEEVRLGRRTIQPHNASLRYREQRNKDAETHYQELVEHHKPAPAAEDAEQAKLEGAALRIEEERDSLQKSLDKYIAKNERRMCIRLEQVQDMVDRIRDLWNPEKLRSLLADL
ncbi:uncharacterized protein LOC144113417 isoform X2 [Amblyomma americanum]